MDVSEIVAIIRLRDQASLSLMKEAVDATIALTSAGATEYIARFVDIGACEGDEQIDIRYW